MPLNPSPEILKPDRKLENVCHKVCRCLWHISTSKMCSQENSWRLTNLDTSISVNEAARRLGRISKWTVHAWLSQGRIQRRAQNLQAHCRFFVDSFDSPLLVWQSAMHVTHIKAFRNVRREWPSKALSLPRKTALKPPKIAPKLPHFVMSKILTVTAENSLCELPLVLIDSN